MATPAVCQRTPPCAVSGVRTKGLVTTLERAATGFRKNRNGVSALRYQKPRAGRVSCKLGGTVEQFVPHPNGFGMRLVFYPPFPAGYAPSARFCPRQHICPAAFRSGLFRIERIVRMYDSCHTQRRNRQGI